LVQRQMPVDSTSSGGTGSVLRSVPPILIIAFLGWAVGFALAVAPQLPGSALTMGLGLATLIILPGFLVVSVTRHPAGKSPWIILSLSFLIGLAIDFGIFFLASRLGLTYRMTALAVNMACLALCAVLAAQWRMGALFSFNVADRSKSEKQADWWALALALGLAAVQIYATLPGQDFLASTDLFVYTRYIVKEFARQPASLPLFSAILTTRGVWLTLLMVVASQFQFATSLLDILWRFAPPALIVMSVSSVYSLACEAFERPAARAAAVMAHALFVMATLAGYFRFIGYTTIFRLPEDKVAMSLVVIPTLIQLLMAYLRARDWRILIEIGIGVIVAAMIHPLALPFIAVTFFSVTALTLLATPSRKLIIAIAIAGVTVVIAALLMFPLAMTPLLQRYKGLFPTLYTLQNFPPSDPDNQLLYTVILVLSKEDNNYIVDPTFVSYAFIIIGLWTGVIAGIVRRRHAGARMLAGITAALYLVMFTPRLTPMIGLIVPPDLLWRFSWLFPIGLSLGWALTEASRWAHRRLARVSALAPRLAMVALMLAFWAGSGVSRSLIDAVVFLGVPSSSETRIDTATRIAADIYARLEPGSTVLVRPRAWLSEALDTLAPGIRVVPPFRTTNNALLRQTRRFYQPGLLNQRDIDLIRKYNIGYIVMPASMPLSGGKIVPGMTLIIRYPSGDALYQISKVIGYWCDDPARLLIRIAKPCME